MSASSWTSLSGAGNPGGAGAPSHTRSPAATVTSPRRTTWPFTLMRPASSHCLTVRRDDAGYRAASRSRNVTAESVMDCAIVCLPNSRANGGKVATGPPGGAAPRGASVPRPPTLVLSKQRGRVDMDVLARFALPGIVALSAIGALIAAVLLVRYGVV